MDESDVMDAREVGAPMEKAPPWSGVTLLDLFASTVQLKAHALAFADNGAHGTGPLRRVSFREADAAIARIRDRIEDLALPRSSTVLVCLGATVEAPLTLFAILRAGLIPCLVPPVASEDDLVRVVRASGALAAITVGSIGALRPAEAIRSAAVMAGGPRYVLAFGDRVPAGVIGLGETFGDSNEVGLRDTAIPNRPSSLSVVTAELGPDGPSLFVHDQEALVALSLNLVLKAGMNAGETVVSTLSPMAQAGLIASLTGLLSGCALYLQPVFTGQGLTRLIEQAGQPHLVVPATLEQPLTEAGLFGGASLSSTVVLHRPPVRFATPRQRPPQFSPVVDLLALGERTLIMGRRGSDGRAGLSLAEARVPEDDGSLVLGCRQDGALRISVSGASVAAKLGERKPDRDTDWSLTPFIASLDRDGQIATMIRVNSPLSNYPAAVT